MIDLASSGDEAVRALLSNHPDVGEVRTGMHPGIEFLCGNWRRRVLVGDPNTEISGLVEIIDNNPMMCADEMSVPDPLSTLALIAVGPLAWAGMLLEPPGIVSSVRGDEELLSKFLATAGWEGGADLLIEERDLGSVGAIMAMAAIPTPVDWAEIDALYEERFGRSFYVHGDATSDWDPSLVADKSHAVYRLSYTPGDLSSLLSIQVLADLNGKCGAAQIVHAMNVMAGCEESLGVA